MEKVSQERECHWQQICVWHHSRNSCKEADFFAKKVGLEKGYRLKTFGVSTSVLKEENKMEG